MKKAKKLWIGIMLSLVLAISGMAGVTAQLHTVYADETDTVTVTFVSKGVTVETKSVAKGGTVSPTNKVASTDTEKLTGWNLNGSSFSFGTPITQNITLTAVWEDKVDPEPAADPDPELVTDPTPEVTPAETNPVEESPAPETMQTLGVNGPAMAPPIDPTLVDEEENNPNNDGEDIEGEEPANIDNTEVPVTAEEEEELDNQPLEPEEEDLEEGGSEEIVMVPRRFSSIRRAPAVDPDPAPTTHNVTFNVGDHGTAPEAKTVNDGGTVEKPADPTADGYMFEGWFTDDTFTTAYTFGEPVTGNVTLYAKWTEVPKTYTVTFDVQGHGTAPTAVTVTSGEKATKPADPTADGYKFEGWFAEKEYKTAYTFEEAVTDNVTIYAKWTEDSAATEKYTVIFDAQGHGTAPAAQEVESSKQATKPADPTAEGYTFGGWQLDGSAYEFSKEVTSNLTLKAVWTANKYTIHFDANNSTYGTAKGSTADVSCTYDTEAKLTKNGFSRSTDWEFTGWNTAANGSGTAYADQATVKNLTAENGATVTLYAQWKFIYKMVAGANASVSKLDTRGLTFQTNGFYSLFTGVAVDGKIINASNYTASAANYGTYITLKQDYIKTLSLGQHTIQFIYSDGSVSTTFNVNNSTVLNPVQTGDNSHMALWVAILAGAAAAAIGFVLLRRKYNR